MIASALLALLTPCSLARAAEPRFPRQVAAAYAVLPGIDSWAAAGFSPLAGRRVGLITNLSGRDTSGRLTAEVLAAAEAIELATLFAPEHGLAVDLEGPISDGIEQRIGVPILSLYGETRRPTAAMLSGLQGLVFDVQDVGTRFYTYATTMAYAMEAAATAGIPFVVLDRPNPIQGSRVEGPVLDEGMLSFVGYAPLPLRHGMTIGELALYFNTESQIGADLTVIPALGWRRELWYDMTGLSWINPSPNIRNLTQALLYPAVGPLEATNVSVGRGTDEPFEWFGAPWIDARQLAAALNAAQLPGVRFVPRNLTPSASVHADQDCGGVNLIVSDRERFDSARTAITLATTLMQLHSSEWQWQRFARLWGTPLIEEQLRRGIGPDDIAASWDEALRRFKRARQRYLLYD